MATVEEILGQIAAGESDSVEFKRLVDNAESVAGEIVAFANVDGGVVFFGVEDNGAIAGLSDSNTVFQTLTNICRDRCMPPVNPILEQMTVQGQEIIVLTIKPELNRQKPYRTAGGRFYVRVGRDKKDATGRELIRIAQAAGELHYDESPVVGTSLADLSLPALRAYHQLQFGTPLEEQLEQSGMTLERLLRNLRLVHDLDGQLALSVACLLIFGETPQRFMPQSRLSAVAFAGIHEDSDILDRREMMGRLPTIIEDTRAFLERNIRQPAIEHGFQREDILLYDRRALGEVVVNAIATLLTQLGYMSAIGTGVPRLIIRLSRTLSGREPEFVLVGEELRVRIWSRPYPLPKNTP